MSWYLEQGAEADVVVSSRIRLARNLSDTHFPWRLTAAEAGEVTDRVHEAFSTVAEESGRGLINVPLESLDDKNKLEIGRAHV